MNKKLLIFHYLCLFHSMENKQQNVSNIEDNNLEEIPNEIIENYFNNIECYLREKKAYVFSDLFVIGFQSLNIKKKLCDFILNNTDKMKEINMLNKKSENRIKGDINFKETVNKEKFKITNDINLSNIYKDEKDTCGLYVNGILFTLNYLRKIFEFNVEIKSSTHTKKYEFKKIEDILLKLCSLNSILINEINGELCIKINSEKRKPKLDRINLFDAVNEIIDTLNNKKKIGKKNEILISSDEEIVHEIKPQHKNIPFKIEKKDEKSIIRIPPKQIFLDLNHSSIVRKDRSNYLNNCHSIEETKYGGNVIFLNHKEGFLLLKDNMLKEGIFLTNDNSFENSLDFNKDYPPLEELSSFLKKIKKTTDKEEENLEITDKEEENLGNTYKKIKK